MSELDDEVLLHATEPDDVDSIESMIARGEVPEGYTKERGTGIIRPKIKQGRPKVTEPEYEDSPSVEDLKAQGKVSRSRDKAPTVARTRSGRAKAKTPEVPYKAGVIAAGMNKLYSRLGKFVRGFDRDVGQAIIDVTRKESEDDVTVGEAWDELARTNPRIRKFLMSIIKGGAYTQLFWAHAPILLAIVLKPAIISRIPFGSVMESWGEPDEHSEPDDLSTADMSEMMNLMGSQLGNMGIEVTPEMMNMVGPMMSSMGRATNTPRRG